MTNKKIMLVTLVHNRKHLVGEAIQSAINQTLSKDYWVHLIIDNASTDGADQVAEVFANKHEHIHFVRMNTNLHQMPAYNWALGWVREKYPEINLMTHLDSDDKLGTFALEETEKAFAKYPEIGQIYSDFNVIDKKGNIKIKAHGKAAMVPNQFTKEGQIALRRVFLRDNPIGHLRSMRIDCLEKIGGFDESKRFATDYNMAAKMLEKFPIIKLPKILYNWRQHDIQVERQHSPEQTKNWKDLQAFYREKWKKDGLV